MEESIKRYMKNRDAIMKPQWGLRSVWGKAGYQGALFFNMLGIFSGMLWNSKRVNCAIRRGHRAWDAIPGTFSSLRFKKFPVDAVVRS
jgi:hypothetical protein